MRVLFLDFDGVLNSIKWRQDRGAIQAPRMFGFRSEWKFVAETQIDPIAVQYLADLVSATDCCIVISSSWRKIYSLPDIQRMLNWRGFDQDERIIGATPSLHKERGHEIRSWIEHCGRGAVESFAIFDDDSDMDTVRENFVHVNNLNGLMPEHVEAAQKLLLAPSTAARARAEIIVDKLESDFLGKCSQGCRRTILDALYGKDIA